MKKIYRVSHFWIILAIMTLGAMVYYADHIPWLQTLLPEAPFQVARYSTYRILSIIPVAYAAFVFRWQGGIVPAVLVGLALLPRAILFSTSVSAAVSETIAFFLISLLVTWLIHRQQHTLQQLEQVKETLQVNVKVIKDNEKRLSSLNRISSTVSETLSTLDGDNNFSAI